MRKFIFFLSMALFLATSVFAAEPDQILVNSEKWQDVYSTMLYGSLAGHTTNFLVSDKHSMIILSSIPKGSHLWVISSKDMPYVVGYESILQSNGYTAEEFIYDNVNLELASKLSVNSFVIVDDSYGYNAISVAPYAAVSNSYVLFADRDNIADVEAFLSTVSVKKMLIYGHVDREVRDALSTYNPEIIDKEGDRFDNNIEIVKKYQEIKHAKQAILTNGEFIEKEVMSGAEPVVFIGANNVPDQIRDYVQNSEIEVGVLIGNELVGTATYIRRNVGISVFVKFAQGARQPQGSISQVEALDMFYLPVYTLEMNLDSIQYNIATDQLEVTVRNTQEQAVYFKGTYSLTASDGSKQKVGDITPIFLDGNELRTVVYDLEKMPAGEIMAEVYIIYGESKGSMERLIDTKISVERVEVLDKCEISINNLVYDKKKGIFYIEVEDTSGVECYIDIELVDVLVDGAKNSFGSDEVISLKPGQKKDQKVKAKLSEADIEDNNLVKVRAYYGERETSLVKILEGEFELVLKGGDYLFYSLLIIIIILIILIIWRRYKDKKKKHAT